METIVPVSRFSAEIADSDYLQLIAGETVENAVGKMREAVAAHLARQRNTANKLRSLYAAMGQQSPDHARLRALGRCRDCLYYCNGVATRSDTRHGATMTLG